jgi:hypothetical protein
MAIPTLAASIMSAPAMATPTMAAPVLTQIPLYLLNYTDNYGESEQNIFESNKQIAVKLFPGPHVRSDQEGRDTMFKNPVQPGMKITWPSNQSTPAKVTGVFVSQNASDSIIKNIMYITLDKAVDPSATVFYLDTTQGFRNMAVAPVLTEGYQSYQNPYNSSPATQQSLEFRLGQNAISKQVQNAWLM